MLVSEYEAITSPTDVQLTELLICAAESVSRAIEAALAPHNVTLSQYKILVILAGISGTTTSMLAHHTKLNNGALTRQLDRLEKANLVERCPDHQDRRRIRLYITEHCAQLLPSLRAMVARIETLLNGVDDKADFVELVSFLRTILQHANVVALQLNHESANLATIS